MQLKYFIVTMSERLFKFLSSNEKKDKNDNFQVEFNGRFTFCDFRNKPMINIYTMTTKQMCLSVIFHKIRVKRNGREAIQIAEKGIQIYNFSSTHLSTSEECRKIKIPWQVITPQILTIQIWKFSKITKQLFSPQEQFIPDAFYEGFNS